VKPKAVLAYCREKGIRAFDLRYCDLDGNWRQVTLPVTGLNDSSFEEGFGQEIVLHPKSSTSSFSILMPNSHANYLDPLTQHPTLVLVSTIQDNYQLQESPFDSRFVAQQSLRYLQATGIADDVQVRNTLRFGRMNHEDPTVAHCNLTDDQFVLRCDLMDKAIDAGVNVDRHYSTDRGVSDIVLRSTSLIESGDDVMMMRYLIQQMTSSQLTTNGYWATSQWNMMRNEEPLFPGTAHRGLSDTGIHAQAGIVRHAPVLAAIFLLPKLATNVLEYPYTADNNSENSASITRAINDASSPRTMTVELRGVPVESNHYLAHAATVMAMIDGIQNKWMPPKNADLPNRICTEAKALAEYFNEDWDFLNRGDVFQEELIEFIRDQLHSKL
jgi:glutamine synthetase